jgi:hypothetical protein
MVVAGVFVGLQVSNWNDAGELSAKLYWIKNRAMKILDESAKQTVSVLNQY